MLRSIGLWCRWDGVFPCPEQLFGNSPNEEAREALARYIEESPVLSGARVSPFAETRSLLLVENQVILKDRLKSDGVWIFSESLAYYVRKGVRLPREFCDLANSRGYCPPASPVEYDPDSEDYGEYWIWWSVFNSHFTIFYLLFLLRLAIFYPIRLLLWPWRKAIRP